MSVRDMVKYQIVPRGIKNKRVLDAMRMVPREQFVPQYLRSHAFDDHPLPIGKGQTISQPYIVALMTELLDPQPGDKILEIGTGSGYQTAVLSQLASDIYTIEIVPELGRTAKETFRRLGYHNIFAKTGDGGDGWIQEAPFNGIIITAAAPVTPKLLEQQLADGGKMVVPIGPAYGVQELSIIERCGDNFITHQSIPVRFVPMTGKIAAKKARTA